MNTITEPPPPELAPSETQAETPMFARIGGATGLFLLTAGVVSVIAAQYGRGLLGDGLGYFVACLGLFGLLVHAGSDSDIEVRRLYGGLATALLLAAVVVSLYPFKPPGGTESKMGALMLPYGASLGLLSLLFFLPFSRHETEEAVAKIVRYVLLAVGGAATAGAVVAGMITPDFLLGPGLVLAVLGLGFLALFLSRVDSSEGLGFWVTVGLGVVGAIALCYALGRSIAPSVLHEGPSALKTLGREYDKWKVAARVVAILVGLGIASIAATRSAPIWLRAIAAVLGLTVVGVFVVGSFATPVHETPGAYLVPHGLVLSGIGIVFLAGSIAVCVDLPFVVLARRELTSYFVSPIGYIVLFGMALFAGIGYLVFLNDLGVGDGTGGEVVEPIVAQNMSFGILGAFQAIFLVPALTMRLFSEEKRSGTLEVLLTAPVSEVSVVLSKFVAAWIFFMLCWIPAGLYLVALRAAGDPFDYRPLLSFYLAVGASGAGFLAMGIFFSSLTQNQVIAAVLTFAGMTFLLLTVIARKFSVLNESLRVAIGKLDFLMLWQQAVSGQLAIQAMLIQLSLAGLWLFLTVKVLEARKWS